MAPGYNFIGYSRPLGSIVIRSAPPRKRIREDFHLAQVCDDTIAETAAS